MKRKSFICGFIIVLLLSPAFILAENLEEVKESRNKRQAQVLLPIASYAGMTVSAPLFAALVAAYGIYAVTKYAISKVNIISDRNSKPCANNGGWCRKTCHSNEHIDWRHEDFCGPYYCCRPGRRG